MDKKKKIAVIGSINTDFTFCGPHIPKYSETVQGESFRTNFGGKGANVSVAMSRLGADVTLFGMVGNDVFSGENLKNLRSENVNANFIGRSSKVPGGSAGIFVGSDTNSIMVIPGANAEVSIDYINSQMSNILSSDIFCMQLEVPLDTITYIVKELHGSNKVVVFNPSPIQNLPIELYNSCNYIIVNEVEIKYLPGYVSDEQVLEDFAGRLILTRGGDGVDYYDNGVQHINALHGVEVVDTTGAGDTFLGAFTTGISEGMNLAEAIKFANVCAGLKIGKPGAQSGMPKRDEVDKYLHQ